MTTFVPYNERQEWKDIVPVPQDDGPNPLVPIMYSKQYQNSMDYCRALMLKDERSERALELTERIIFMNPAHYTIWQYRFNILESLKADLRQELEFLQRLAMDNPKSYQIWHYRQVIIEKLNDSTGEFEFVRSALEDDAKNYHTWTYRQWLVRHFNLWEGELDYIEELIDLDIRNNSAWNHRFFIVFHDRKDREINDEIMQREIEYAISKISLAPNNPSPWNYLRGVIDKSKLKLSSQENFARKYAGLSPDASGAISVQALGYLVEVYDEKKQENGGALTNQQDIDELDHIFSLLSEKYDRIRSKYWSYRRSLLIPNDK